MQGVRGLRRLRLTVALAVAITAVLAGAALAAVGDLTFLECIEDADTGTGACLEEAPALHDAQDAVVSPDGTSVYVAAGGDDAIARFDRDPGTGALTERGCVGDEDTGDAGCNRTSPGLDQVTSVAISPDGTSVYAGSQTDSAVVRFDRDPASGKLSPKGCVDDPAGADDCAQSIAGLGSVRGLTVSPDGVSVYSVSGDDAVIRFARDPLSGKIKPKDCVQDDDIADDGCADTTAGLANGTDVVVSPDNTSVYVSSEVDDTVTQLRRATPSGRLSPRSCIEDNDTGTGECPDSTDGLETGATVDISPDGQSVYVGGSFDDAIAIFKRGSNGGLTAKGCIDDDTTGDDACLDTAAVLNGPADIAVSPDGESVYVAAQSDSAAVTFKRGSGGGLTFRGHESFSNTFLASGLAVSPEGDSVYVTALGAEAINTFDREAAAP